MSDACVTAVVVAFNSEETILHALGGLSPAHQEGWLDAVVVDNCSSDRSIELIRREQPWVEVLPQAENLGCGRGCNVGLARAATPFVLLLNPDAVLPAEDLRILVDFLEGHPRAGMVGPAVRNSDGGLQCAGRDPTPRETLGQYLHRFRPPQRVPIRPGDAPFPADWLSGAALLLRRSLVEQLGGFDPRFFLYFEETDLCRRAKHRGWEVWAHGGASARHRMGGSSDGNGTLMYQGCIAKHYFESRFYYFVKHYGWLTAAGTEVVDYLASGAVAGLRKLVGRDAGGAGTRLRAGLLRLPRGHHRDHLTSDP